jgi:hypothetical protein
MYNKLLDSPPFFGLQCLQELECAQSIVEAFGSEVETTVTQQLAGESSDPSMVTLVNLRQDPLKPVTDEAVEEKVCYLHPQFHQLILSTLHVMNSVNTNAWIYQ